VKHKKSWYLKVKASECAPYVILVGDPARQNLFIDQMENVKEVAFEREFKTITGYYHGTQISVVVVGIGAPSAVLVLEELWELGVKVVVRAGTGLSLGVPLGDFILVQAATRNEGTSISYLPPTFPAVPDIDLLNSFSKTLEDENVPFFSGVIMTSDGFYTELFNHQVEGRQPTRPNKILLDNYLQYGIISADMETSALYIAGQYLGVKCLTLLATTVDGIKQKKLAFARRLEKEKELARLALIGVHKFEVERMKNK
jgi:uridine phosphorylase